MLFTTKHVMYQVKESVFVTYMYAGIFQLPQCTYTSTASTPHVSRSRATCHVIQSATISVLDALLARL